MITQAARFLPLLLEDGQSLIPEPALMVIAAMAKPNLIDMKHLYETMVLEYKLRPSSQPLFLSEYAQVVKSKILHAEPSRLMAGEVILELCRLAQKGELPGVNSARRLVALDHKLKRREAGTFTSIKRNVEKKFSSYRDVSHLLAVFAYKPDLVQELEEGTAPVEEFLGLARAFETFIDHNVAGESFKWNPFRIPRQFPPILRIEFPPLQDADLERLSAEKG